MIAEVFPEAYDARGRKVLRPDLKVRGFHSTAPMHRYVSQPISVKCNSTAEVREFLATCKYVSDEAQFGRKDYWQPPEEFERTKKGDCDCFALWTWREFLDLGYDARFVIGRAGRYGEGHAWVQFSENGRTFLVESTLARLGDSMPRLTTLRYRPKFSVAWDGRNISYYAHEAPGHELAAAQLLPLVFDWILFWTRAWGRLLVRLPIFLGRIFTKFLYRSSGSQP
jgi:hypothetical protein